MPARAPRWWLLIHQIPPTPAYLRAKIGRRLAKLGAVALKNSVYVLPHAEETQEDLAWVLREVQTGGGDATLCEASFVEGIDDAAIEQLFRAARAADYHALLEEAESASRNGGDTGAEHARLSRRLAEIEAIDFFAAPECDEARAALARLDPRAARGPGKPTAYLKERYRGRTWVTRAGVKVDRIASAWLVRRYIDPEATFKLVAPKGYRPLKDEVRFDMTEAEMTHEGDACTFEVLVARFGLRVAGLDAIAEIVHDIDVKDAKYRRVEAPGIAASLEGIARAHLSDEARFERGFAFFDDLLAYFAAAPAPTKEPSRRTSARKKKGSP